MSAHTQRSEQYWSALAKSAIRGLTQEQADAIGKMSHAADRAGRNPSVWHQSAILFGHPCKCVPCRAALAKARGES